MSVKCLFELEDIFYENGKSNPNFENRCSYIETFGDMKSLNSGKLLNSY